MTKYTYIASSSRTLIALTFSTVQLRTLPCTPLPSQLLYLTHNTSVFPQPLTHTPLNHNTINIRRACTQAEET